MFERYTEPARRALFFSRYEASRLGSRTIEPYHVLLGLMREASGITNDLLLECANPIDELARELEGHVAQGPTISTSVEIPFSPATKRGLTLAAEEADALSHPDISCEHLLLGLLRTGDVAAAILHGRGLSLDKARHRVAGRT